MLKKLTYKRILIQISILLLIVFNTATFAYWSIQTLTAQGNNSAQVGQWEYYTPIDPEDPEHSENNFLDMVQGHDNGNNYRLEGDLDLSGVNLIRDQDDATEFSGTFDGNGHTLILGNQVDERGIFSVLDGATIKNLKIDLTNVTYSSTNASIGILAGRIYNNVLIENVEIIGATVNKNGAIAGGLIGLIQPESGTANNITIRNVRLTGMNIVANGSFADYGSGGLIGSISSANVLIEDIYFEGVVTTTGHHAGGLIGAILTGSAVTIRRAVVYGLDTNNSTYGIRALSTNMYTGAFVGRNQGTLSITDALFRGRLRAATNNYYGIQVANGTNATGSNIRAVAMSTYNGNTLNNINQTRWNAMAGQKPTYSTFYVSNIMTLTSSWWNTNFANITSRPAIWQYNGTTRLYQIIPLP